MNCTNLAESASVKCWFLRVTIVLLLAHVNCRPCWDCTQKRNVELEEERFPNSKNLLGGRVLQENVNKEGSAAEVGYDDDNDLEIEGPLIVDGEIGIDMNGIYLLVATVGACILYVVYCCTARWLQSKRTCFSIDSGRFRLFAARGDVAGMALLYKNNKKVLVDCHIDGWTALHAAVVNGQCGSALWLLQQGSDINALKGDSWGDSILHYAAEQGHEQMVKMLVEWGADVFHENGHGQVAADVALQAGYPSIHDYLVLCSKTSMEENINKEKYKGKHIFKVNNGPWKLKTGEVLPADQSLLSDYLKRSFDGYGTEGTQLRKHVIHFRYFAVICQLSGVVYLVWRALRSLRPGLGFIYSAVFWLCEFFPFVLSNSFFISLWYQISRPDRYLSRMIEQDHYPKVEIFVVTYNEPLSVIEPTVIACINMDYPGDKLTVCVLDDGGRDEIASMSERLSKQMEYMERKVCLKYATRKKTKGVNHHAKAGNINNFLMKGSNSDTDFVVIFDCDMIPHPGFLDKVLGHFYSGDSKDGGLSLKPYCAFTQIPQDFWNVDPSDTMVHCARFFYGPMLQGRDGAGACPCCGTGVVFRRDILVSMGGQSYGSITEDYNTSMHLLASGFSSQYLNARLVFGMAPNDIVGIFKQRLRWAVGALQIFYQSNPLQMPGLTPVQRFLFFESSSHYFLAISTLVMCLAPIVYVFTEYSPLVVDQLWELCVVFGFYYLMNRTMWVAHLSLLKIEYYDSESKSSGVQLELWRGSQLWVWMAPNNIRAIVIATVKHFTGKSIAFAVTDKGSLKSKIWPTFRLLLPYLLYYIAYVAAVVYFLVIVSIKDFNAWRVVIYITALAWATLIVLYLWPPVSLLLPRAETNRGWRISWNAFFDTAKFKVGFNGALRRASLALAELPLSPFENMAEGSADKSNQSVSPDTVSHRQTEGRISYNETVGWDNVGRVALPHRTSEVLGSSLLLTNNIFPEPQAIHSRNESSLDLRLLSLHRSGTLSRLVGSASLQNDSSAGLRAILSCGESTLSLLR